MRFKNYEEFVNESFVQNVMKFIQRVGKFFTGLGSRFLNALVLQKENSLPKGVKIYPTSDDLKLLKEYGVAVPVPALPEMKESMNTFLAMDEAVIHTKYPDIGKVKDVNSTEMLEYIRDAVESGKNSKPLLIWGAPGIGKTAIINAIAMEYFGPKAKEQRRMIDFDLMTMSPEDFFMPAVSNRDTPEARGTRLPDEWLPIRRVDDEQAESKINGPDQKGGILFFDEIARCSARVQGVCLKLIDERRIGNYVLGEKWVIICAANRKSDLSDDEQAEFHWSSTLANRFQQINYASTMEDWTPWALTAKDDLGELIVKPEIIAFLKFNSKYYHLLDPEDFSNSSGGSEAWPSPRTWVNASAAIKAREKRYEKDGWKNKQGRTISREDWIEQQQTILAANVGAEAANAFVGFQRLMMKLNPEDIKLVYTDPDNAPKWKGLGIDQMHALISATVFQMKDQTELTKEQMKNFTTWLCQAKDAPNCIKAVKMLVEVVPALQDPNSDSYEYWNNDCMNRFVDAYPGTFDKSKQKS